MADFFVLLNDGSSYVLLNDGSSKVLLNFGQEPEVPPKPSISHTTLDAGVDLREKKPKERQKQILKLTVEIPTTGTATAPQQLNIETKGTAKQSYELSYKAKGTAKITNTIPVKTTGTSKSKQFTTAGVQGEKSAEMYNMKRTIKKLRLLDTLKEALRELDDK